ncbi:MAG: hypothetical protein B9S31_00635 [Spartobacteria bacterium Tous-C9RFEB]|nr:MAG: hypothetical protein B9S31_00635 [Spartobacteria bacterium Tous-C9RFEB]
MRFTKLSSSTKVTEEQSRLSKAHAGLVRQEQALQKTLLLEAKKEKQRKKELERKKTMVQVSTTLQAPFTMPRSGKSSYSKKGKPLAREIQNDKVKFLLLCLVFAVIIVMLWRAIPS